MKSSTRQVLLAAGAIIVVGVIAAAMLARRRPVLLSISPDPTMVRPRNYCLMNPFRDRSPERVAEEFINQLRTGHVSVLTPAIPDSTAREHFSDREMKWPIAAWRIGDRKDLGGRVDLMYWVKRGNGYAPEGSEEEIYITVDRSITPARVTAFSAIY